MGKIKFKKPQASLKVFITISVIFLSVLVVGIYSLAFNKVYYKQCKDDLEKNIKRQCHILENNLINNDFGIVNDDDLNLSIDTIASFFDGRVMVIDSNYRVIKDTFVTNENSIIINEDIIKIMTGERAELVLEEEDCIKYISGVYQEGSVRGAILLTASLDSIEYLQATTDRYNFSISAVIFFVCVVAAVLLGTLSVKGIKRITRYMEIVRDGDLGDKVPVKGFKEMRALTENYNETIDKLMVIDSTRQEFVSNVSHELKTPITSMKVLADSLIQNEEADLPMYKEFMSDIADEIERESKIINDLLTLVKMDKKSAEMNIEEIDINALLEIILKRVSPIASSRGIEITYESYREVMADVDEVKLSLALTNIIENAVKYNVDNGWVKVTLNADHKNFHVKVADSGVGIPDDCKSQVFERFYRVDKARSRDTGGTGLGLAITKNVILMHKGTIKLYSESGEGTTFTIKIPIKYVES